MGPGKLSSPLSLGAGHPRPPALKVGLYSWRPISLPEDGSPPRADSGRGLVGTRCRLETLHTPSVLRALAGFPHCGRRVLGTAGGCRPASDRPETDFGRSALQPENMRSGKVKLPAQGHTGRRRRSSPSSPPPHPHPPPPLPARPDARGGSCGDAPTTRLASRLGTGQASLWWPPPAGTAQRPDSHAEVDTVAFFFLSFFLFFSFFTILFITISVLFSCKGIQQKLLKRSCPQSGAARLPFLGVPHLLLIPGGGGVAGEGGTVYQRKSPALGAPVGALEGGGGPGGVLSMAISEVPQTGGWHEKWPPSRRTKKFHPLLAT